jgi:hypothetical protein
VMPDLTRSVRLAWRHVTGKVARAVSSRVTPSNG